MLNSKSFYVIDRDKIPGKIHIVGVGALGSMITTNLVRLNLASKIVVYDPDTVEAKNLNNQAYLSHHVGLNKAMAMKDLCLSIDTENPITARKNKVDTLRNGTNDIIILAIDNFESRAKILTYLRGMPLVVAGGISSIGGSYDVLRGSNFCKELAAEYNQLPSGQEYDENDLTPCGSPISIYHRIGFAASLITEAVIQHLNYDKPFRKTIAFDIPNHLILNV